MGPFPSRTVTRPARGGPVLLGAAALLAAAMLAPLPAFGGQASAGKLAFHPCTKCHPVTDGGKSLPNGFEKHEIELEIHDVLGRDEAACLRCHDDPTRDPGKLKLPDGSLIDIKDDAHLAEVCRTCHSAKYEEWQQGVHGKGLPKCTSAGCHDPHTPGWIFASALPPFTGTGFQFRVLPEREPFKPLAPPPVAPAVQTPAWLLALAAVGLGAVAGLAGKLVSGRAKR